MWYTLCMIQKTEKLTDIFSRAAVLAPMAGFTDSAFRRLCTKHGAGMTVSEMISAKAVHMGDKKSLELMEHTRCEGFFGIQLFGSEPDDIAYSAALAVDMFQPDFIDINMGCPAPKITGPGAGSKLMADLPRAAAVAEAAVRAASVPVSCKIRAGFKEITAPQLAPMLEDAGVSFIFMHGRTRDQMYRPPVDLDVIRDVKASVSIPVIGNGDIASAVDALRMIRYTGCDGVMIGRGALGDPFLFSRIAAALSEDEIPPLPSLQVRLEALLEQAENAVSVKGEFPAMREMRKHTPYYIKGVNGAAALRAKAVNLCTLDDLRLLCREAMEAGPARE